MQLVGITDTTRRSPLQCKFPWEFWIRFARVGLLFVATATSMTSIRSPSHSETAVSLLTAILASRTVSNLTRPGTYIPGVGMEYMYGTPRVASLENSS